MEKLFVYYGSKRFKIGHQYDEHTYDISTLNNKEILAVVFGALGIAQVNIDFNDKQDKLADAGPMFIIIGYGNDWFVYLNK